MQLGPRDYCHRENNMTACESRTNHPIREILWIICHPIIDAIILQSCVRAAELYVASKPWLAFRPALQRLLITAILCRFAALRDSCDCGPVRQLATLSICLLLFDQILSGENHQPRSCAAPTTHA